MESLPCFAIVVAGGRGVRLDPNHPKQYLPLCGKPILVHTLERFFECGLFEGCIVVLPPSDLQNWDTFCSTNNLSSSFFHPTPGGNSRFESVDAGLNSLYKKGIKEAWIAIHDGVRPLITTDFISFCINQAKANGNAIPATIPVESFRYISNFPQEPQPCSTTIDRDRLRSIQTPQCALFSTLLKAWKKAVLAPEKDKIKFTDEASVLEYYGEKIHLCQGLHSNVKITQPIDLQLASFLLTTLPIYKDENRHN